MNFKHLKLIAIFLFLPANILAQSQTGEKKAIEARVDFATDRNTKPSATPATIPKQIAGGVLNGKAISLPKPHYPPEARLPGVEGIVKVQVLIDEGGNIISANSVSGPDTLRSVSELAAMQAKFAPTLLSGQPVKVSGVITYNFVGAGKADKPESSIFSGEERESLWGFGMILSLIESADVELIHKIGDEAELVNILKEMAVDAPEELKNEKPILDRLAGNDAADRMAAAKDFKRALGRHLSTEEKWLFELGEPLGYSLTEIFRARFSIGSGNSFDTSKLRTHLKNANDHLLMAPLGTPDALKSKFRTIFMFADYPDLASDKRMEELFFKLGSLMEEVSK